MTLPDEVAWFLARRSGDIRKLEGALNVIEAFTSMTGQQITVSLVQNLIAELADVQEERPISIADIERAVADRYKLKGALLRSKKRNKEIAHARHVAMYLARTLTSASLPQIGKNFGDRDHTSVLHACNKIKGMVEEDWRFKEEVEQLIRTLQDSVGSRGNVCQNRASNSRGRTMACCCGSSGIARCLKCSSNSKNISSNRRNFCWGAGASEIGSRPVLQQDLEQLGVVLSRYGVMLQGVVPILDGLERRPTRIAPNVRASPRMCRPSSMSNSVRCVLAKKSPPRVI